MSSHGSPSTSSSSHHYSNGGVRRGRAGRAAIESDPRGLYALGNHCGKIALMQGMGAPSTETAAAKVLMAAAGGGGGKQNALAHLHLGQMFQVGRGVVKDIHRTLRCYTQAADKGNAEAQYLVANAMLGLGPLKAIATYSPTQARAHLESATAQGHTAAQVQLGEILLKKGEPARAPPTTHHPPSTTHHPPLTTHHPPLTTHHPQKASQRGP